MELILEKSTIELITETLKNLEQVQTNLKNEGFGVEIDMIDNAMTLLADFRATLETLTKYK